jgi:hypothetical protein
MTIALPGSHGQRTIPVHTGASALANEPIDVDVTALVTGSRGSPSG